MANGNGEGTVRSTYDFGALEQRVRNMEGGLSNIRADISALTSKIDTQSQNYAASSKTNWSVLASFFSAVILIIGALGSIAKSPIDAALIRLDSDVREVNRQIVPRAELDTRIAVLNRDIRDVMDQATRYATKAEIETSAKRRDDIQKLTDERSAQNRAMIEQVRDRVVPRGEHERVWAQAEQQANNLQRQIDDQKRAFGDTFSLRDALQNMQRRIDTLEAQRPGRTGG